MDFMAGILHRMQTNPNRIYAFTEEKVWQAVQFAVIRLISLGITGYDSPVAAHSLPEAVATLQSLQRIVTFYANAAKKEDKVLYQNLQNRLAASVKYLSTPNDFNGFDRLRFIKDYANTISEQIYTVRSKRRLLLERERSPLGVYAKTIFSTDAFDIGFFSPNERYSLTPERIELGEKLFYDPRLSSTGKRSCASCHKPELAFTDGLPKALALDEKKSLLRNTPTLWNSALQTKQFYDSRTSTLEDQLNDVVHNAEEMKGSLKNSVDDLLQSEAYRSLFAKAYPAIKQPIMEYTIANAVSSYVRSLVALNSRFDQYMRGNEKALSPDEKTGFNLFAGKAKCATCHFIPLFNGVVPPEFNETESEVLGVPKTKDKKKAVLDEDKGKFNFTRSPVHLFAFKTPTLRNAALTPPYMHNGVYDSLEEVMDFYNDGGGSALGIAPETQTLPADKLNLTEKETRQIIQFLKALNDTVYRPLPRRLAQ